MKIEFPAKFVEMPDDWSNSESAKLILAQHLASYASLTPLKLSDIAEVLAAAAKAVRKIS